MHIINRVWRQWDRIAWQIETRIYLAVLRLLRRLPAPQQDGNPSSDKLIYLTFDDGPSEYTGQLLEILKRYNVKVTFFVTKRTDYLDLLGKIAGEGHSVGNHTANHEYDTLYASETSFLDALSEMEEIILEQTRVQPTLFRFPGGSSSIDCYSHQKGMAHRLTALVQDRGYQYFDWNLDSRDTADALTPRAVYRNVRSGVRNRKETVVLQHDIKRCSIDAIERILVWGIKNGYTFLPLGPDSRVVHHRIKN